ncbi:MAG TPA: beta-xylosidase [Acidobacteriota bacterium]|nr:beta-xylosidase [Acidobacteriota bacterium]
MVEAIKLWNEPNNLSHWDFQMDPDWREFTQMTRLAAKRIRRLRPDLTLVLGGISPVDPNFVELLASYGLLDEIDVVAIHGFPLDWSLWDIDEWPDKVSEIEAVTDLPIWITEAGASSFGSEEVQAFGLERTSELLLDRVEAVFWYSLLDLPESWEAATRHKESEGSSYYRHFYMGLVRPDGSRKPAFSKFRPKMGICQWFHFKDPRLDHAVALLRELGVSRVRTGISWCDWLQPGALRWFDRQMEALHDFKVTLTLCFTPPSRGKRPCYTSPPIDPSEFAAFAEEVVRRYVPGRETPPIIDKPSNTESMATKP